MRLSSAHRDAGFLWSCWLGLRSVVSPRRHGGRLPSHSSCMGSRMDAPGRTAVHVLKSHQGSGWKSHGGNSFAWFCFESCRGWSMIHDGCSHQPAAVRGSGLHCLSKLRNISNFKCTFLVLLHLTVPLKGVKWTHLLRADIGVASDK